MSKTVIVNGKKEKLSISIDGESLNIYVDNGETKDPTHVVYWHIEEVVEDADIAISMVKAVQLFYTDPQQLVDILKDKVDD